MPYPRNPFFTGREKVLEQLHAALTSNRTAALSGLGGIGKTQTAIEYAYRHRDDCKAVLWAKADSREALVSSFVALAERLNLPEKAAQDQNLVVAAVKRWLEGNTNWLLILDNADNLTMVREFLPLSRIGQVLFTTRAQTTGALAQRVEIEQMELGEGTLFLLHRAKVIAQDALLDAASDADRTRAEAIVKELGGLPLALDQAGAFIEEVPSSLVEYLELYKKEGVKLLAKRGDLAVDHSPSVTVTFSLALQQVAARNPAAADLLRACAFLAPDAIPEEIFTTGMVESGNPLKRLFWKWMKSFFSQQGDQSRQKPLESVAANPSEFVEIIKEAGRFSLIDRNPANKTLDIHRLVQEVLKEEMDEATQRLWAERTVRAMSRAFPDVEFSMWPRCERLLPHTQAGAELIEKWGLEFPEAARLLNKAGFYLDERAHYAEAEPLCQRALAILEKVLGPEHPNVATSLNNLALLYYNQGKDAEAEPLYQRALAIHEKALGPDHPAVATSLNNLALLYKTQGKDAEAEPLYQRALAIHEKALGPDHPAAATNLNNLALLYYSQGKYAEAEPLYQRALAIWEKVLGPEHPNVANSLNNLAGLYDTQGQYGQAEPLYQRALAIREKVLGPEHPAVATVLENYADLLRKTNRNAEADTMEARAKAIRAKHAQENPTK